MKEKKGGGGGGRVRISLHFGEGSVRVGSERWQVAST